MALISVCECMSFCTSEVMEDSLDGFPVYLTWVFKKLREYGNGKGNVRASGNGSIYEAAYGLMVGYFLHACSFSVV